ncbi:dTDP-glucose 4,6-dehydratase [Candidatus Marinimicrobia bacterium MT.SAG.3]|nr:dTDP-glucose 4,6-dehydratase [Candidatus Marinimicrobia bacterium MT.SAG.3]
MKRYLVTGGSGFIGSRFVHHILGKYNDVSLINVDKLTYAGNQENLKDVSDDDRYRFYHDDICDKKKMAEIFREHKPDIVVNFAAESHVDRSIGAPEDFIQTDVFGAFVLLEEAKKSDVERFIQISTDEVYGSTLGEPFRETDPMMPSSPYSASKTGADRLAYSYFKTYDLPVIISRASNNYGSHQYPEKLIPLFITNAIDNKQLPLYGDGLNVRDWLYADDHCSAIDFIISNGVPGEVYNIGGGNELTNIMITDRILELTGKSKELIKFVDDRPGHDRRYALDTAKLSALGWDPAIDFKTGMEKTVNWYIDNRSWWEPLKSGEYLEYYKNNYGIEL